MRLNCRRYCRPLPPPTPSLPPLFVQRLCRRFNPALSFRTVAFRYILLSLSLSRFFFHPRATIMHRDPSRHRYGFRSFPSTYDFESRQLPSPYPLFLPLMYPSFLKLRLKLYNEHALYRVSRHNLLSLFLTSWDTQYSTKHSNVLACDFEAMLWRIYVSK